MKILVNSHIRDMDRKCMHITPASAKSYESLEKKETTKEDKLLQLTLGIGN